MNPASAGPTNPGASRQRRVTEGSDESDVAPSVVSIGRRCQRLRQGHGHERGSFQRTRRDGRSKAFLDQVLTLDFDYGFFRFQIRQKSLEKFRVLISESPLLKHLTRPEIRLNLVQQGEESDSFLLRFLRLNKFNPKWSTEMMESHLRMKAETPSWFTGLGSVDGIEKALELLDGYIFVAPGRDRKGRKVMINVPQRLDPARHSSSDMMKAIMMSVETLLAMDQETQVRGLTYIFYCRGLTLKHCGLWTLAEARKMFTVCEKNVPLRHRAMFVVETPFGMGTVIEFAKSFFKEKIRRRIHVVSNVRTLHLEQDRVLDDPDVLPVEFLGSENGGDKTISDMAATWKKVVMEHLPRLEVLDDLKVSLS